MQWLLRERTYGKFSRSISLPEPVDDTASEARRYGKKVLVACGSEDVITPEAGCKKIAAAFARGEYRTLPGIGHVPHMEAAEAVNRLIAGFVPK